MNIITRPKLEWPVIAAEPRDIAGLYLSYIAPLAAIPVICSLLGMTLVGVGIPFADYYRVSLGAAIPTALVRYVLALLGTYVAAVVIARLAPLFQSRQDTAEALKLVAYSMTPVWIAGVVYLVPALSTIVLVAAIYAIYVCYLGVAPVMSTPADRVVPYLAISAIVLIAVYILIAMIVAALMPAALIVPRPAL